jgi:hypothetical protein
MNPMHDQQFAAHRSAPKASNSFEPPAERPAPGGRTRALRLAAEESLGYNDRKRSTRAHDRVRRIQAPQTGASPAKTSAAPAQAETAASAQTHQPHGTPSLAAIASLVATALFASTMPCWSAVCTLIATSVPVFAGFRENWAATSALEASGASLIYARPAVS